MKIFKKKAELNVILGDITKGNYQCIVNAANQSLQRGGGVCGAIYKAAGPKLEQDTNEFKPIGVSECKMTGGYDLCEIIIHAVGPIYEGQYKIDLLDMAHNIKCEQLKKCYENIFDLCKDYNIKNIALPLISTGIYGFPKREAIQIALEVIHKVIKEKETNLKEINIVCFELEDYNLVYRIFKQNQQHIFLNYLHESKIHI